MPAVAQDELLTPDELASWFKVPVDLIYRWNYKRTGPKVTKLGGRYVRYRRADVEKWLEERDR